MRETNMKDLAFASRVTFRMAIVIGGTAAVVALPARSQAQGTIGFTSTHTTIDSGGAFTSLENGLDWTSPNPIGNIPAPSGNVVVASPNALQRIRIESWRETGSLRLTLWIEDQSVATACPAGAGQPPCTPSQALDSGDKVIIQIDPTNARNATLAGSERRFEIAMNPSSTSAVNNIDPNATGKRVPSGMYWSNALTSFTTPTVTRTTHPVSGAPAYKVDVTLTFGGSTSDIGTNMSGNFGIAIAVVNDLGHSHGVDFNGDPCTPFGTGNCTVPSVEMTGVA